jgi:hypothetical protein
MLRRGRTPRCLCGECKLCKHRQQNNAWRAKRPDKVSEYKDKLLERQRAKRAAEKARPGPKVPLDEHALKWLQERGFR